MENKLKTKCLDLLRRNLLVILTLIGVAVGFTAGFILAPKVPSHSALLWIGMYL